MNYTLTGELELGIYSFAFCRQLLDVLLLKLQNKKRASLYLSYINCVSRVFFLNHFSDRTLKKKKKKLKKKKKDKEKQ